MFIFLFWLFTFAASKSSNDSTTMLSLLTSSKNTDNQDNVMPLQLIAWKVLSIIVILSLFLTSFNFQLPSREARAEEEENYIEHYTPNIYSNDINN